MGDFIVAGNDIDKNVAEASDIDASRWLAFVARNQPNLDIT
jgi:hypothetical protein